MNANPTPRTDSNDLDLRKAFRPQVLLIKPRTNKRKIGVLEDEGILVKERTVTEQFKLISEHREQRGAKHYKRSGTRINSADLKVGDSGKPIKFNPESKLDEKDADRTTAATLANLMDDLDEANMTLVDVHIVRRAGERRGMGQLTLVFIPGNHEEFKMSDSASRLIKEILADYYRSVFIFMNPDGSATVNANQVINQNTHQAGTLFEVNDPRTLRVRDEEGFHWSFSKQPERWHPHGVHRLLIKLAVTSGWRRKLEWMGLSTQPNIDFPSPSGEICEVDVLDIIQGSYDENGEGGIQSLGYRVTEVALIKDEDAVLLAFEHHGEEISVFSTESEHQKVLHRLLQVPHKRISMEQNVDHLLITLSEPFSDEELEALSEDKYEFANGGFAQVKISATSRKGLVQIR